MGRVKKSFNEKYNSPFAANMRELMKEYGVTQDTLAAKIGRTRQTVCQYVNGESEPGYETLAKIADFFSVSTDYLLGISLAKTPGTTMQAVTEYTGLSEDNVLRLFTPGKKRLYGNIFYCVIMRNGSAPGKQRSRGNGKQESRCRSLLKATAPG